MNVQMKKCLCLLIYNIFQIILICVIKIKKETKATIRCIPITRKQNEGKCMVTGKKSKGMVVFAKAY